MTAPFMRAYTELLVKTCHKRGAFAMGGMAAVIPNRRHPEVTEGGMRLNLYVAVAYTAVWLSGNGAVAIHNLMEDAATAEISRSQVWQQIRNKSVLADTGNTVTRELVQRILGEETERLRAEFGDEAFRLYYGPASKLIEEICLSEDYTDFLTTPAYELVG
jgi:malate synthase